jgi:putative lipase involved disintegration of autophagic bodies
MEVITIWRRYFGNNKTIYLSVKEWYPRHTNIWMAGHSLGGALASLVALTNDLPAFAYQSPGDLQYASRLGLLPQGSAEDLDKFLSELPIYHFGNTGDPIFLGQCTGVTSSCYWLDYALESKCHTGKECIYGNKRVSTEIDIFASIQYHSIEYVIKNIIEPNPEVAAMREEDLRINNKRKFSENNMNDFIFDLAVVRLFL